MKQTRRTWIKGVVSAGVALVLGPKAAAGAAGPFDKPRRGFVTITFRFDEINLSGFGGRNRYLSFATRSPKGVLTETEISLNEIIGGQVVLHVEENSTVAAPPQILWREKIVGDGFIMPKLMYEGLSGNELPDFYKKVSVMIE